MSRAVYRAAACFAKPAARKWKGCKRFPGARGKSVFFRSGSGQQCYPSSAEAGRRTNAPMPPENLSRDPRVYLAAERTFLAWIRTGLSLMAFGFVIARFGLLLRALESSRGSSPIEPLALSMPLGVAFVLMGVLVKTNATPSGIESARGSMGDEPRDDSSARRKRPKRAITKPNAISESPVRIQARNVRSAAR